MKKSRTGYSIYKNLLQSKIIKTVIIFNNFYVTKNVLYKYILYTMLEARDSDYTD